MKLLNTQIFHGKVIYNLQNAGYKKLKINLYCRWKWMSGGLKMDSVKGHVRDEKIMKNKMKETFIKGWKKQNLAQSRVYTSDVWRTTTTKNN